MQSRRTGVIGVSASAAVFVLGLAALVLLRLFFVNVSFIPQNGMYPTVPARSYVLSWRRPYERVQEVKRGDIVLFTRWVDGQRYLYVWRVVGLPGDAVRAAGEVLEVNGSPPKRELIRDDGDYSVFRETLGDRSYEIAFMKTPRHVPPEVELMVGGDELFVMGDNRYGAMDSRTFGPIKFSSIIGKKF